MGKSTPNPTDARAFRDALGRYATGVTVVTTFTKNGPLAMTANSFASVSMDPPLVLWSPAKSSSRHDDFAEAAHFCIHVLAECQSELAARFARDGRDFPRDAIQPGDAPAPVLRNCSARFECIRHAVYPGGDHSIILGRVERLDASTMPPLVFLGGRYGCFA
ncbi:flavin reductase family protein [Actibacterium mucosum]|uniref:flavin reductase family protein n=1 Tax=Actibacterium mucosum TaxID=1087332 RepID=UPI000551F05C|nr:flavin reductase family protein [Actibacterium mucosum]